MSDLHTYRITYPDDQSHGVVHVRAIVHVKAFTAADAVAQWRADERCHDERILSVEPLPDSPTVPDERAEAERVPVIRRSTMSTPIGGINLDPPPGYQSPTRIAELEAELRHRTEERDRKDRVLMDVADAVFGEHRAAYYREENLARDVRGTCKGRDEALAEVERLKAERDARMSSEAAIRKKFEGKQITNVDLDADRELLLWTIHYLRLDCGDTFGDVRLLVDAITGTADPGNHTPPGRAARIARETREERDRLRNERDALAGSEVRRAALQKRLDAAKAWITAARDGADMANLLAILEGRTS